MSLIYYIHNPNYRLYIYYQWQRGISLNTMHGDYDYRAVG